MNEHKLRSPGIFFMPTTRAQQKLDTRLKLLETAAALFAEQGYEDTTTRQIAQHCGMSIGTVFAHFPNKQVLLQAVLYEGIEAALGKARQSLDPEAGVDEAMAVFATSLYKFYRARRQLSQELLKHNIFNAQEFTGQLTLFRDELVSHINHPKSATANKALLADTLLSHYFYVLVALLNEPSLSVPQAVDRLRQMNALALT